MKAIHVSSRLFIGSLRSASSLYLNQLCPLKLLSMYARSIVLHASRKRRFSSDRAPRRKNEKRETRLRQNQILKILTHSLSIVISNSNYSCICVTHQSHSQDGSLEAKETAMTNITPVTSRTNKIEACCLMFSEQSFSLRRLLHFLLLAVKPPLDGKQPH